MTFGQIPTGEKEPARWEKAVGDERDQADFLFLLQEAVKEAGDEFDPAGDYSISEGEYILRRGKQPIGYFLHQLNESKASDGKNALFIIEVYVRKTERDAEISNKLIQTIRAAAQDEGASYVQWRAAGEIMPKISKKARLSDDSGLYTCPVEQFGISTFIRKI